LELSIIESLSSSKPRSGEVEADESEREALGSRSCRRERVMAACLRAVLRVYTGSLERSFMAGEVDRRWMGGSQGKGRCSGVRCALSQCNVTPRRLIGSQGFCDGRVNNEL
jgi:hypothetical protein